MTKLTIHVKPTESALNGITLYEQIDMDQLDAFKNTDHAKRAYDENHCATLRGAHGSILEGYLSLLAKRSRS